MSSYSFKLEELPDKIQFMVMKYLSLHDLYYSLFHLNCHFNNLIKHITPVHINIKWLNYDIDQSGILISDYWVWNDRFIYFMIPKVRISQPNIIQWLFIEPDSIEKYRQRFDSRVFHIIQKYYVHSNAPGLLVSKPNYYFCSISEDLVHIEEWIRENYPAQYEVVQNFGPRHHLPKRITHYDGKYLEIKQALTEVQRLERLKRKSMIYQCAQNIWSALRELDDVNILNLLVDD